MRLKEKITIETIRYLQSIVSLEMVLISLCCMLIIAVDVVHGGVGLKDCREVRCNKHHGPAIRFPFWLKGRQPSHCGYKGFDLSCTKDHQTVLPSADQLFIKSINYKSQEMEMHFKNGCLPRQIFDLRSLSSPFEVSTEDQDNFTLFTCPPAVERDRYYSSHVQYCLRKVSPCLVNISGNQIYAVSDKCSIDQVPLLSCGKMHDYTFVPDVISWNLRHDKTMLRLNWSKPSCQHCEEMGKACRLKNTEFPHNQTGTTECFDRLKGPSHGRQNLMITGFCAISTVLIVTAAVVHHAHSSRRSAKENELRIERFLDEYRALKPNRYSYADIKMMTNQFDDKLGQGAYGTVFKGKVSTELLVAVKILNNSNEKGENFINEVGTMCRIHHVNVVRLVGFCADGFVRALVYEFQPNGSLQNFLSSADNKNSFLGWNKLQDIALGIAKGIEYLHQGCDQRILHFDIKPHNVLLDQDFTPKVSDFGLAKLCSKDQSAVSMTTARGTMGYIAPEILSRNFGNVSYKSDVYSFGTLLLEMVGGKKNFKVLEDSTSEVYFPQWIYNLLEQGADLRIHIEDGEDVNIARKLAIVGLWCIQWHPMDRPSMKVVVQMLEREDNNLTVPPNPFASTSN